MGAGEENWTESPGEEQEGQLADSWRRAKPMRLPRCDLAGGGVRGGGAGGTSPAWAGLLGGSGARRLPSAFCTPPGRGTPALPSAHGSLRAAAMAAIP